MGSTVERKPDDLGVDWIARLIATSVGGKQTIRARGRIGSKADSKMSSLPESQAPSKPNGFTGVGTLIRNASPCAQPAQTVFLRRRIIMPAAAKPPSNIIHVLGSGTSARFARISPPGKVVEWMLK